jgi:uncharacterized protein YegL
MNAVLQIGVLIDNSPSMNQQKLNSLQSGFQQLITEFSEYIQSGQLKIMVVGFDRFQPKIYKSFKDQKMQEEVVPNRFPLLGRSLSYLADQLLQSLESEPEALHTPWIIVLSNGLSLDSVRDSHPSLQRLKSNFNLRYLPFLTTREKIHTRAIENEQFDNKKPMIILDQKLDLFFNWLKEDIRSRLETPLNERVTSDKKLLDGWTIL